MGAAELVWRQNSRICQFGIFMDKRTKSFQSPRVNSLSAYVLPYHLSYIRMSHLHFIGTEKNRCDGPQIHCLCFCWPWFLDDNLRYVPLLFSLLPFVSRPLSLALGPSHYLLILINYIREPRRLCMASWAQERPMILRLNYKLTSSSQIRHLTGAWSNSCCTLFLLFIWFLL